MLPTPRHHPGATLYEALMALVEWVRSDPQDLIHQFERAFALFSGKEAALGVNSARTGLYLILDYLKSKFGYSTVLMPEYCFFSLVEAAKAAGYEIKFAACCSKRYALDVEKAIKQIEEQKIHVVLVIHPFGHTIDVQSLSHRAILIEDISQSIGAQASKVAGTCGTYTLCSLTSGKNITAFGGGFISGPHKAIAAIREKLPHAEFHFMKQIKTWFAGLVQITLCYPLIFTTSIYPILLFLQHIAPSFEERMFAEKREAYNPQKDLGPILPIQASFALCQLPNLQLKNELRREVAKAWYAILDACNTCLPEPQAQATWHALPVKVRNRQYVRRSLLKMGIDTRVDYMDLYGKNEKLNPKTILYLPTHPYVPVKKLYKLKDKIQNLLCQQAIH